MGDSDGSAVGLMDLYLNLAVVPSLLLGGALSESLKPPGSVTVHVPGGGTDVLFLSPVQPLT